MNTTKNNNLSSILIIVFTIVISGGAIAGGIHFLNKNNELIPKINQRQAEFIQMQQKVAMLPLLREKSKAGIAEINRIHQFVPSREEQAAFILELERLAQSCGVDVIYCKLGEKPKSYKNFPEYHVFQWSVELDGNYSSIKKFLEIIPNSKRFMMVSDLNINSTVPESKTRKAYQLNTKLTLDVIAPMEQGKVNP